MRKIITAVIIILSLVFICQPGWACAGRPKSLTQVEVLTGFSQSKLHGKGNFRSIPLVIDLNFDIKKLIGKCTERFPGLLQFQIEPSIAGIYEPDGNVEFGNAFTFKFGILPETSKFQPYLKAALGLSYMTQHTREQSTQFNFFEYGGLGFHYFFKKNLGLTVEYRFRHLSNSGIDHPNHGINSNFGLVGLIYQF